jgi:hypothetical protein
VTGELYPLSISRKVFKKMDKKMYFEPEFEVLELEMSGMLCASTENPEIPQGGGEGEDTPGGW